MQRSIVQARRLWRTKCGLPKPDRPGSEHRLCLLVNLLKASLVAQMVKNLTAVYDNWVQSLDREDLLEKGMATHSRILAWRTPWTQEPGGL